MTLPYNEVLIHDHAAGVPGTAVTARAQGRRPLAGRVVAARRGIRGLRGGPGRTGQAVAGDGGVSAAEEEEGGAQAADEEA